MELKSSSAGRVRLGLFSSRVELSIDGSNSGSIKNIHELPLGSGSICLFFFFLFLCARYVLFEQDSRQIFCSFYFFFFKVIKENRTSIFVH